MRSEVEPWRKWLAVLLALAVVIGGIWSDYKGFKERKREEAERHAFEKSREILKSPY